jgi:hypothetical protein
MNIKLDTIIKILLILIAVVIILYYDKLFPSAKLINNQQQLESFITVSDFLESKEGINTIYEKSIIKHPILKDNPELVCNIIPILDCPSRKKFPVHMIKLINNKYVAVFNDGMLYTSDNYKDNIWNGPLINSMPNRFTPLRMINTTPYGNMLVGVAYDGRCYIKSSEGLLDLTVEWQLMSDVSDSINVIYLMYYFDKEFKKARKMIINAEGRLMLQNNDGSFREINSSYPFLLKVFYDTNGYLLGIDENFNLGSFDQKDWTLDTSTYAEKSPINTNNYLVDIIYDNDNKLIGITFNSTDNIFKLEKQNGIGYEYKFYLLDKYEKISQRINKYQIIISKLGMGELLGLFKDTVYDLDNDIELAYQRQLIADTAELRDFCSKRQELLSGDFIDLELSTQLKNNQEKIDKINLLLTDLSTM